MSFFSATPCPCGSCPPADEDIDNVKDTFNAQLERSSFSPEEQRFIFWAMRASNKALTDHIELVKAALPTAEQRARMAWALPAINLMNSLQALNIEPNSDRFHDLMAVFTAYYNTHGKTDAQQVAETSAGDDRIAALLNMLKGVEPPSAN